MVGPDSSGEYSIGTTFRDGRERSLEDYEAHLSLKRTNLRGKTILDIGSGEKQRFASELMEEFPDTNTNMLLPATPTPKPPRYAQYQPSHPRLSLECKHLAPLERGQDARAPSL